jgi:hypothetical protein
MSGSFHVNLSFSESLILENKMFKQLLTLYLHFLWLSPLWWGFVSLSKQTWIPFMHERIICISYIKLTCWFWRRFFLIQTSVKCFSKLWPPEDHNFHKIYFALYQIAFKWIWAFLALCYLKKIKWHHLIFAIIPSFKMTRPFICINLNSL